MVLLYVIPVFIPHGYYQTVYPPMALLARARHDKQWSVVHAVKTIDMAERPQDAAAELGKREFLKTLGKKWDLRRRLTCNHRHIGETQFPPDKRRKNDQPRRAPQKWMAYVIPVSCMEVHKLEGCACAYNELRLRDDVQLPYEDMKWFALDELPRMMDLKQVEYMSASVLREFVVPYLKRQQQQQIPSASGVKRQRVEEEEEEKGEEE